MTYNKLTEREERLIDVLAKVFDDINDIYEYVSDYFNNKYVSDNLENVLLFIIRMMRKNSPEDYEITREENEIYNYKNKSKNGSEKKNGK